MRTFDEVWTEKKAMGFQYGMDALLNVQFGWNLCEHEAKKLLREIHANRGELMSTKLVARIEAVLGGSR